MYHGFIAHVKTHVHGGGEFSVFDVWEVKFHTNLPSTLLVYFPLYPRSPLIIYHAFDIQHPSLFVGVSIQVACLQFTMQPTAIEKKYFEGTRLQVLFVCCSRHHTRNNLTALLKSSVYRFAFRRKKRFF